VQPVDDMHEGNAPSHPELLEVLAREFVKSGFDLKFLTRAIVLSRAYQRTSETGAKGEWKKEGGGVAAATPDRDRQVELFGRMSIKVLSAGQLYDSLETIAGPPTKTPRIDTRQGARWEFTQFFGDTGDPEPTAYRRGIPHLLRQMNSGQFTSRNLESLVARLNSPAGRSREQVADDLFLAILSRRPTKQELERGRPYLNDNHGLRELGGVLMMTSEFSLNH
jgi:hypothetical protein